MLEGYLDMFAVYVGEQSLGLTYILSGLICQLVKLTWGYGLLFWLINSLFWVNGYVGQ